MAGGIDTLRVLIVEDHEFQRAMLERALRSLGVAMLESASNGAEALDALRRGSVDLVFTDLVMPVVDGFEFIPQFAEVAGGVPLVLCSGHDWALEIGTHLAEAAGVTVLCTVRKPLTPAMLSVVFDKLSEHRSGRAFRECDEDCE